MKKLFTVLLTLLLVATVAGCGKKETAHNEVTDLIDQGYAVRMTMVSDDNFYMMLRNEEGGHYLAVITPYTAKIESQYSSLDIFSDTYDEDCYNIYGSFEDFTIIDLDEYIPSESVLQEYVGKTFNEMMELGFEDWGSSEGENSFSMILTNNIYNIDCYADPNAITKSMEDYSYNEKMNFPIAEITFNDLSDSIFDIILAE